MTYLYPENGRKVNWSYQPSFRWPRRRCRCVFTKANLPRQIIRCSCGYLWIAGKRAPFKWHAITERRAAKRFIPILHSELERITK